jgi:hypothetical protein
MTLDEIFCWNTTFIVVDNIALAFGIFSGLLQRGGPNSEVHGFQNNLNC